MCGIAAMVGRGRPSDPTPPDLLAACSRMVATLRHRGPDEQTVTGLGPCVLGHTRLSIIDLQTGSQPLFNEDRTIAALLNGEIYNYRELRDRLIAGGHRLTTQSDTEVLVHLYEELGPDLFSELNGMFAAVIWDAPRQRLIAARDRFGEKPLLYHVGPNGLVLASELKALLQLATMPRTVDQTALAQYFTGLCIPSPRTIFEGIHKLPPAHRLVWEHGEAHVERYWKPQFRRQPERSIASWSEEVDALLADAVRIRMIADVPIGVFLSGGVDSSAITVFMANASQQPIRTFSVGFAEEIDERPYARLVAERYGTEHVELFIEKRVEDEVVATLATMDEPFGDSSIVPTYLISREARRHVKVVLTGDGGDELFAGYPMYVEQKYRRDFRGVGRVARWVNDTVRWATGRAPFDTTLYPERSQSALGAWHEVRSIYFAGDLASLFREPVDDQTAFYRNERWWPASGQDPLSTAFDYDINYYLPDDLLKKVDMASMLASLECRAPFLDHRVVELCMSIPPTLKLLGDQPKQLLKSLLRDRLPPALLARPKQGFGAPVDAWMRGRLAPMVRDLLAPGCRSETFLQRSAIERALRAFYDAPHQSDHRIAYKLWLIAVLEIWARTYF